MRIVTFKTDDRIHSKAMLTCRCSLSFIIAAVSLAVAQPQVFIEAESFSNKGGWVVDQQFIDQMGSPFLLAHGLGDTVTAATTTATFPQTGTYHVYVRTRDWVAPYGPGTFKLIVGSTELSTVFGSGGDGTWQWVYGGTVNITQAQTQVKLKDLSGFDARCDAVFFSTTQTAPPNDASLENFRNTALGLPSTPPDAGTFDFVVVGGGMAGCCAAVKAARLGLKVALIQNRPVLGGNNSSEVRVGLGGTIKQAPFTYLGDIVQALDPGTTGNAGPAANYNDARKLSVVQTESNISLFLNMNIYQVEVQNNAVIAVIGRSTITAQRMRFPALYFADCTGDATVGYLAGADYLIGRETQSQYNEASAPTTAEMYHMGISNMWYSENLGTASTFTSCAGALSFSAPYGATSGNWDWESGLYRNPITEAEFIRDHNLRAVYGVWASEKTQASRNTYKLTWLAYISGKRESRRLIGDVVLNQNLMTNPAESPDGIVYCSWGRDEHFPAAAPATCTSPTIPIGSTTACESFRTTYTNYGGNPFIPYRCFYSRNITNLFMAGRCFSATRIGMQTARVMRTCGMMGEVLGAAAWLCKIHNTSPRGIYQSHLSELLAVFIEVETGIIIDNPDATVVGTWTSSTYTAGFYGTDYIHDDNADKGTKSVTYRPNVTGVFFIDVRWTDGANRATNVPVTVHSTTGTTTFTVNEQLNGGVWNRLGTTPFVLDPQSYIIIETTGTNGFVIADAVRLTPSVPVSNPPDAGASMRNGTKFRLYFNNKNAISIPGTENELALLIFSANGKLVDRYSITHADPEFRFTNQKRLVHGVYIAVIANKKMKYLASLKVLL